MIRESQVNFLIPLTENLQTCIFHESFFPKYNNSKIISIIVICQSNCLELSEWDWLMKEKIQMLSQMFWFVLNAVIYQHEKLKKKKKKKKHSMYRFCECKCSFKIASLWRKLEFQNRVYKKRYIFCCSLNHKIQDNFLWSHRNHSHTRVKLCEFIIILFFLQSSSFFS